MARPIRIEYEGAIHHVTARGNGGMRLFLDERDHELFLLRVATSRCLGGSTTTCLSRLVSARLIMRKVDQKTFVPGKGNASAIGSLPSCHSDSCAGPKSKAGTRCPPRRTPGRSAPVSLNVPASLR